MRILVVNHVKREKSVEHLVESIARPHGWHVTYIRPGNRRTTLLFTILYLIALISSLIGLVVCGVLSESILVTSGVGLGVFFLLSILYICFGRLILTAQLQGGLRAANKIVEHKRPNMIVATGYGAVVALKHPAIRRIPTLMISPGVGQYVRYMTRLSTTNTSKEGVKKSLSLKDTSFTSVAHDRKDVSSAISSPSYLSIQKTFPISDSLDLSGTAPAGASELDIVAKISAYNFDDEEHLAELLISTFRHGWLRIAEQEGFSLYLDEQGLVTVAQHQHREPQPDIDEVYPGFDKDHHGVIQIVPNPFFSPGTYTPWLDQSDLKLIVEGGGGTEGRKNSAP